MGRARVLIAEDDHIVAMELQDRLQRLGYTICATVAYGEEALRWAAEAKPDLVLMDVKLRGAVDGVAAAEQIRSHFQLPVVYLVAHPDRDTLQRAKVTEPYEYVVKPFEERELHSSIEIALYKHEVENRLKKSERWLSAVLENISDAVVIADEEGRVRFLNPTAELLTGRKQEEVLGKNLGELFSTMDAGEEVLWGDMPITSRGRSMLSVGGRDSIPVDTVLVRDDDGTLIGMVITSRGISGRGQVEAEHEQLLAELEAKTRELDSFIYTVSHDLRSPLVSLQGFSACLLEGYGDCLDSRGRFYLERIQANTEHMADLLDSLLELSRIGRITSPIGAVPLGEVVDRVAQEWGTWLEERGGQLEVASDLPTVQGDRRRLEQVMANLLSNAIKFMGAQPHPRVEIGWHNGEESYTVYVRDNGVGIAPEYHDRIFDIFQRLGEVDVEGTGVGLAIVKRIVEHHGGKVWVESDVGHGATFYFSLPRNHV